MMKIEATDYLEMQSYISILEQNNKEINRKLDMMINDSMEFPVSTDAQKRATSYMVSELKLENIRLNDKFLAAEDNMKKMTIDNTDMEKKIQFMDKLIIEKDNAIYALQRKAKHTNN